MFGSEWVADLSMNLIAGLLIFILDVGLIVWLLPKILQRKSDALWATVRKSLVDELYADHHRFCTAYASILKPEKDKASERFQEVMQIWTKLMLDLQASRQSLAISLPCFSSALNPELVSFLSQLMSLDRTILSVNDMIAFSFEPARYGVYHDIDKEVGALVMLLEQREELLEKFGLVVGTEIPASSRNLRESGADYLADLAATVASLGNELRPPEEDSRMPAASGSSP